jgi:hypothetical protein
MRFIDLTGKKYTRLEVIGLSGNKNKTNHLLWYCRCDCGNTIECPGTSLNTGNTKSCGCLKPELLSLKNSTHRDIHSKEYKAWYNAKQRCTNIKNNHWVDYGGRGIIMCDRWLKSYENFLHDMGRAPTKKHSIDRIDNDGNYEPSNCRWTTSFEQSRNTSRNVHIEVNGEKFTIEKLCQLLNIKIHTFNNNYYKRKLTGQQIFNKFKQTLL